MESDLVHILAKAGIFARSVSSNELAILGADKGAYVLVIKLAHDVPVSLPKRSPTMIGAGTYYYVGSANGPGGMAARLKRHMKQDKKVHWHVDQLTTKAASVAALAVAGGNECQLGALLTESGRYRPAIKGFGSSDCSICDSHLLMRTTSETKNS